MKLRNCEIRNLEMDLMKSINTLVHCLQKNFPEFNLFAEVPFQIKISLPLEDVKYSINEIKTNKNYFELIKHVCILNGFRAEKIEYNKENDSIDLLLS